MQKEIEIIIKGKVQMVMFRDFAERKAKAFKLTGIVENLEDGSVRIVAQGDEDKLNKFIELLQAGPMFAKISGFDVKWKGIGDNPPAGGNDFKIIY